MEAKLKLLRHPPNTASLGNSKPGRIQKRPPTHTSQHNPFLLCGRSQAQVPLEGTNRPAPEAPVSNGWARLSQSGSLVGVFWFFFFFLFCSKTTCYPEKYSEVGVRPPRFDQGSCETREMQARPGEIPAQRAPGGTDWQPA